MQTSSPLSSEFREEENEHPAELSTLAPHWSPRIVYMRADVGHLASPLIPFAVFKNNPLLSFHAAQESWLTGGRPENTAAEVELLWNRPFSALTEAQHYFLVAWSAVPHISTRILSAAELAFGIATPGPYYKRWITTRAVSFQGAPVAWCIEVDMLGEQDEIIEIVLSEGNMQHLFPSPFHATSV